MAKVYFIQRKHHAKKNGLFFSDDLRLRSPLVQKTFSEESATSIEAYACWLKELHTSHKQKPILSKNTEKTQPSDQTRSLLIGTQKPIIFAPQE